MSWTIWFTGVPASGKTTLAKNLNETLKGKGCRCEFFDSDEFVKQWYDYFTPDEQGRDLNNRIMALASKFLNHHGIISLVASTMAKEEQRQKIRQILPGYIEIYCQCSLSTAKKRDPKGLYRLSQIGIIPGFPDISKSYEEPASPDLVVNTETSAVEKSLEQILLFLRKEINASLSGNWNILEQKKSNSFCW